MLKKYIRYGIIIILVCIAGVMYSCERENDTIEIGMSEPQQQTDDSTENLTTETFNQVCVHVSGYVNKPGVYMLDAGSRVYEAIELAGGFQEEADEAFLNLAAMLQDGQKIVVLSEEEAETAMGASGYDSSESETGVKLININTATKESLMTLPGIGESRAESIITYREKNGDFSSIKDIMKVSGIKEAAFEKIKDYICTK